MLAQERSYKARVSNPGCAPNTEQSGDPKERRGCSDGATVPFIKEQYRSFGALHSRMRDSGWDQFPPDVRFAGKPAEMRAQSWITVYPNLPLTETPSCEAGYISARPTSLNRHFRLATRGRSIQMGQSPTLSRSRMCQQRLPGLPFRDQCAAMAVGYGDEAPGHVICRSREDRAIAPLSRVATQRWVEFRVSQNY